MNRYSAQSLAEGTVVLSRDGMLLDERRWDDWLQLYTADCVFWMPMWADETTLNNDPRTTLSHIYYDKRKGLEDRIARIRSTRKSPASTPPPRTAHMISNIIPMEASDASQMNLRASWACHVLYKAREQHVFFGWSEYTLISNTDGWRIARKKIVLQNDNIPTMLDIYCV